MASRQVFTCDRCKTEGELHGAKIDLPFNWCKLSVRWFIKHSDSPAQELELCDGCAAQLADFILGAKLAGPEREELKY